MKLILSGILVTLAMFAYVAFAATFTRPVVKKPDNPYWLTQWALEHQDNPEVQAQIEITKQRSNRP